ncbi:hypothetical protein [Adhaeretor mobilis]|uniref:Uncharacterized protein n=1 Tax=Adhaeretor mobilis TaxID=1930276 RepID=A0A517MWW3_9BACT|nr:hypothetical protein [Adhaeretor mobilis]QDS99370.1 hypothetical protein HG15A2_26930 [Adhaeretor mobilis]
MCKGISILKARLKQELFDEYELEKRIVARAESEQPELHFMYPDPVVELPVEWDGQTLIMEWGNRGNKESKLPRTGWCRKESLDAGKWRWLKPEPCIIPANFGLEKGVWFHIDEGLEGVVVRDEQDKPHVYMLTQAASVYYENMTRHERMPVLVGQVI